MSNPPYLADLFRPLDKEQSLRNCIALQLTAVMARTELAKHAFSVVAPTVWNGLPAKILLCRSVSAFMMQFKKIHFCHDVFITFNHQHFCIFGYHGAIQVLLYCVDAVRYVHSEKDIQPVQTAAAVI